LYNKKSLFELLTALNEKGAKKSSGLDKNLFPEVITPVEFLRK